MGEEWAEASSIPHLFPPTTESGSVRGTGGKTSCTELMEQARERLAGRWGVSVATVSIYYVILLAAAYLPQLPRTVISILVSGPLAIGLCTVFLNVARRSNIEVSQLFNGFSRLLPALIAHLAMNILVLLWALLLIVPGIMASISYSLTFYIMADNPTIDPLSAIRRSKEMMYGHRLRMFYLWLRFAGWILLYVLTMGIGVLWLIPYMQTSIARFYDDLNP